MELGDQDCQEVEYVVMCFCVFLIGNSQKMVYEEGGSVGVTDSSYIQFSVYVHIFISIIFMRSMLYVLLYDYSWIYGCLLYTSRCV